MSATDKVTDVTDELMVGIIEKISKTNLQYRVKNLLRG